MGMFRESSNAPIVAAISGTVALDKQKTDTASTIAIPKIRLARDYGPLDMSLHRECVSHISTITEQTSKPLSPKSIC